ncbi:MAG: chemotaxis protein CheW [Candidatus Electrothrix sp. GW3-4]|uniref:chemotaxis protein CheW n=1 Tax=Candidatus Electrothrix sp. GW3-4 TaxID=3126740 RepID=UPI0030CC14E1
MAVKKKKAVGLKAKTVSVYLEAESIQGRKPVLLFTASQVDEVLAEAHIQPLPFASEYLVGLCAWREQVLPTIDLVRFFGLSSSQNEEGGRYLVVRAVKTHASDQKENIHPAKTMLRCVLKVSDQIISGNIPEGCQAVVPKEQGFASAFVRGLFQGEKELFILPDITAIIHSNSLGGGE